MANDRAYIVTYVGDGVVNLPRVGIFQAGTRAWVDAEIAELARRHGHFMVTGPDGMTEKVVDEMPPPAPPAPVAAAPAPAPAATPRPRRGRQSVVMTAVDPDKK